MTLPWTRISLLAVVALIAPAAAAYGGEFGDADDFDGALEELPGFPEERSVPLVVRPRSRRGPA